MRTGRMPGRSLTQIRKRRGPITELWGTPKGYRDEEEHAVEILTLKERSDRKFFFTKTGSLPPKPKSLSLCNVDAWRKLPLNK